MRHMRRDEIERRMQALAERRAETARELQEAETRLVELEDERNALSGTLAIRRRAVEDLASYERQLQEELSKLEVEEAEAAVSAAVAARDAAVADAARKANELRAAHDLLERRRAEVKDASDALRRFGSRSAVRIPEEPTEFSEEWQSVAPLVEQELNRRLESELVTQAARSGNPLEIDSLPAHLQALARERRRELIQQRRLAR